MLLAGRIPSTWTGVICSHTRDGTTLSVLEPDEELMQQVTEPTPKVTVLTRSLVHRRAEHSTENTPDLPVKPASDAEMATGCEMVAKFLLATTRASGVAVAILDETGLHCRASAGEAPQPGTAIRLENSISGQCIRSGASFHCDDTLTKCPNALPARSILLLPVIWGRNTRGLVALFSRQPQAFGAAAMAIARSAAAMVAIALNAWTPQLDAPIDGQVLEADIAETMEQPVPAHPPSAQLAPVNRPEPKRHFLNSDGRLRPAKELCGLPCATCGAYFAASEANCPVCQTARP